jgi:hypothetical protein
MIKLNKSGGGTRGSGVHWSTYMKLIIRIGRRGNIKNIEANKATESAEHEGYQNNDCGTWEMTSGNSQTKQRHASLKWFIIKLYLKDDPTYM